MYVTRPSHRCHNARGSFSQDGRACGERVTSALCFRWSLAQSGSSLSCRQMARVTASFHGNWRIVLPTSFHLEYYTTLHNVYIQLNRPIFTSLVSRLIICNSCSYCPPPPCLSSLPWVSPSATFVSQSLWFCSCLHFSLWSLLLQFSLSLCVCFCLFVLLYTLLPWIAPSVQRN